MSQENDTPVPGGDFLGDPSPSWGASCVCMDFNFDTQQFEPHENSETLSDERVAQFIPMFPGEGGDCARALYRCLRAMGKSKTDAYVEALCAVTGTKLS